MGVTNDAEVEASGNVSSGDCAQNAVSVLSVFKPSRVLSESFLSKRICIEGTVPDGTVAVIVLEQNAFSEESFKEMCNLETILKLKFRNDVYYFYECIPEKNQRAIKTTIIHPATPDQVKLFETHPVFIWQETSALYNSVTLPYISGAQAELQSIYDILDHKTEDKILYEDLNESTGFVLVSHSSWDQKENDELHVVAIVRPRTIKSLRDLTREHLPLLKNVENKTVEFIKEKYNISNTRLAVFLHYQPSYYHLHIHFANLQCQNAGLRTETTHMLSEVVNNIELVADYYQKSKLAVTFNPLDSWIEKQVNPSLNDLISEILKFKEKTEAAK